MFYVFTKLLYSEYSDLKQKSTCKIVTSKSNWMTQLEANQLYHTWGRERLCEANLEAWTDIVTNSA